MAARARSRIPMPIKKNQKRDGDGFSAAAEQNLNENVPTLVNQRFRLRRSMSMDSLTALPAQVNAASKNEKRTGLNRPLQRKTSQPQMNAPTQPSVSAAADVKEVTKRPVWDLRGQIRDLQAELAEERSWKNQHLEQLEVLLKNKDRKIKNLNEELRQKEFELLYSNKLAGVGERKIAMLKMEIQRLERTLSACNCKVNEFCIEVLQK